MMCFLAETFGEWDVLALAERMSVDQMRLWVAHFQLKQRRMQERQ